MMTSPSDISPAIRPLRDELSRQIAHAVCGDDHLTCTWPDCGCRTTKQRINAVALVVGTELSRIMDRVADAFDPPPENAQ
jgi:hypothetical protein